MRLPPLSASVLVMAKIACYLKIFLRPNTAMASKPESKRSMVAGSGAELLVKNAWSIPIEAVPVNQFNFLCHPLWNILLILSVLTESIRVLHMQKLCRTGQFFTIVKFQLVILNEKELSIIL
jgi:hypothetical protein